MSSIVAGAGLAAGAAVALNASFLIQHAGSASLPAVDGRHPVGTLRSLLQTRAWVAGSAVGLGGWALHLGAMREAPLSLVQAFVAGGLVLTVPLAAVILHRRLAGRDLGAIAVMAGALVALVLGAPAPPGTPVVGAWALALLIAALVAVAAALAAFARGPGRAAVLAVAGGLLYGAADLALKAVMGAGSVAGALASPWLAAGLVAGAGAFFAFQRALQDARPVSAIALMTASTNVASIAGALAVYGDPLGRTPGLALLHGAALMAVVAAAWRLAPAQARLAAAPA